jgi:hypothetical protein
MRFTNTQQHASCLVIDLSNSRLRNHISSFGSNVVLACCSLPNITSPLAESQLLHLAHRNRSVDSLKFREISK